MPETHTPQGKRETGLIKTALGSLPRSTFIVVVFLAVFAAVVAGVNIARIFSPPPLPPENTVTPTLPVLQPTGKPEPDSLLFSDDYCQVSFAYPAGLTERRIASGTAILLDAQNDGDAVLVTCNPSLTPPDLPPIGEITVSGQAVSVYDTEASGSAAIRTLFFRHPETDLNTEIIFPPTLYDLVTGSLKLL